MDLMIPWSKRPHFCGFDSMFKETECPVAICACIFGIPPPTANFSTSTEDIEAILRPATHLVSSNPRRSMCHLSESRVSTFMCSFHGTSVGNPICSWVVRVHKLKENDNCKILTKITQRQTPILGSTKAVKRLLGGVFVMGWARAGTVFTGWCPLLPHHPCKFQWQVIRNTCFILQLSAEWLWRTCRMNAVSDFATTDMGCSWWGTMVNLHQVPQCRTESNMQPHISCTISSSSSPCTSATSSGEVTAELKPWNVVGGERSNRSKR